MCWSPKTDCKQRAGGWSRNGRWEARGVDRKEREETCAATPDEEIQVIKAGNGAGETVGA